MIRNVRMSWIAETHSFEFQTNGSRLESLDFLGDFIGSLKDLYEKVIELEDNKDFPSSFKVRGSLYFTDITPKE